MDISHGSVVRRAVILLVLPIIIEILIFNYRSLSTLTCNNPTVCLLDDGSIYQEGFTADGRTLTVDDPENLFLSIEGIDLEVNTLAINVSAENRPYVVADLYVNDEGMSYRHYKTPVNSQIITPYNKGSRFFKTFYSGKLKNLWIHLENTGFEKGDKIYVDSIVFNERIPFEISLIRLGFMYVVLLAGVYLHINKGEKLAAIPGRRIFRICGMILLAQLVIFAILLSCSQRFMSESETDKEPAMTQYHELAEALADGQLSLHRQPPQWLSEIDNPYDDRLRDHMSEETGEGYAYDVAYYKGQYYVYFGIVPAAVFFLPIYLLTGSHLPLYVVIYICLAAACAAWLDLLRRIIIRWYQETTLNTYIMMSLVGINCMGGMYWLQRPGTYEVPPAMATALVLVGLDMWMAAAQVWEEQLSETVPNSEHIGQAPVLIHAGAPLKSTIYIAAGSLSMALVAGCRPQVVLTAVLAVPIFANIFTKSEGEVRDLLRRNVKSILAFILPFILTALLIMAYNHLRFGSVFDFGAQYNLTREDLVHKKSCLERLGLGIYEFVFRPLTTSINFPFLQYEPYESDFFGRIQYEGMHGGILWTCPVLLFMFYPCLYGFRSIKNRCTKAIYFISAALGITDIMICVNAAGIIDRYTADFSFLVILAATVSVLELEERYGDRHFRLICLMCTASIILSLLGFWLCTQYRFEDYVPQIYYSLKYALEFWK